MYNIRYNSTSWKEVDGYTEKYMLFNICCSPVSVEYRRLNTL